jgi:hypothetical protein
MEQQLELKLLSQARIDGVELSQGAAALKGV